jgi:hypothetical protein
MKATLANPAIASREIPVLTNSDTIDFKRAKNQMLPMLRKSGSKSDKTKERRQKNVNNFADKRDKGFPFSPRVLQAYMLMGILLREKT